LLRTDIVKYETAVNNNVKVSLTQSQFDALVSFTYNIGTGGFKSSSALKELNKGNYDVVPSKMKLWNKVTDPKTHKLKVSQGLVNRRAAEANLFKNGIY